MKTSKLVFWIAMFFAAIVESIAAAPMSVETWASDDVLSVQLSRHATHLAILRAVDGGDSDPAIEVYKLNDEDMELVRRINSDPMKIDGFNWINDNQFVMALSQQVRHKIDGFNRGVYSGEVALVNVESGDIASFAKGDRANPSRVQIRSTLPAKENKILITVNTSDRFYPEYYELDLENGRKRLVITASPTRSGYVFDAAGNPVFASTFVGNSKEVVYLYKANPSASWDEVRRTHLDDFERFSIIDIDPELPDHALVLANNGHDMVGLWSYDLKDKEFHELIFRRADVDVSGVAYHSNFWTNADTIVGVRSQKAVPRVDFFDGVEEALYNDVKKLIPNAYSMGITSRSEEGSSFVVVNSGPLEPRTYYLYHNGRFRAVGSTNPEMTADQLANVKFFTYKARDGRTIPAHMTIPRGEAPFPLVVMPHGGPFVTERIGFDEWAQMLANHGYLVLQPQYRGSTGYGLEHYTSAFLTASNEEKSEAGYAMQDDLDDGALDLVDQGLADKDRMAMWGWSYGGYTSLVAAMRDPQIYQCTVAGAAVSDPIMQVNYYRDRLLGTQRKEQLVSWAGAFSPFRQAHTANVPMLIVHGNNDQRVPVDHAKKLMKRIGDSGVHHRYVEIEGIDHFSSTMQKSHKVQIYTELLGFLADECGPEGL